MPYPSRRATIWLPVVLFLAGWGLLLRTACPTVFIGDSGELAAIPWTLSVTHPTGYPLATNLGHLYLRLIPLGSIAFRMSLWSAAWGAFAGVLTYALARRTGLGQLWSSAAALAFLTARTSWSQAVIPEVYTLHACFTLSLLLLASTRPAWLGEVRQRTLLAFLLGLSFSHHMSTVLWLPGLLLATALFVPGWRRGWVSSLCAGMLGLAPYLHLPIQSLLVTQSNAVCALYWGDLTNLRGVLMHLSGRSFQRLMFAASPSEVSEHLRSLVSRLLPAQWGGPWLALLAAGVVLLTLRQWRWAAVFGAVLLVVTWWNAHYSIVDIQVFYLAVLPLLAVTAAWGGEELCRLAGWGSRSRALVLGGVLAVAWPASGLGLNWGHNDLSRYRLAHDYGWDVLHTMQGSSYLLTQGWITPYVIGYLQAVEEARTHPAERVYLLLEGRQRLFRRLLTREEPVPEGHRVYTTVPLDISGEYQVASVQRGLLWEIGSSPEDVPADLRELSAVYRLQPALLEEDLSFLDYQSRSLLASLALMNIEQALTAGDQPRAAQMAVLAEQVSPGNRHLANNLAAIYFRHGLLPQARQSAEHALALDPNFEHARHNLGNIAYRMGDYNLALRQFTSQAGLHWRIDFTRPIVGDIYLRMGRAEEALGIFQSALALEPENVVLLNRVSDALTQLGRLDEAEALLRQAIEQTSSDALSWNNLGLVLQRRGDGDGAERALREAIRLNPDFAEGHNNLGALLAAGKDYLAASRHFREAIAADQGHSAAWKNLGTALWMLGEQGEARQAWRRSLDINPNQPQLRQAVGE